MQEPWPRVVSYESDSNVVRRISPDVHDIPTQRVVIIICLASCAADNGEGVLLFDCQTKDIAPQVPRRKTYAMQMHRMLFVE